jgi:hypothetical protein
LVELEIEVGLMSVQWMMKIVFVNIWMILLKDGGDELLLLTWMKTVSLVEDIY